MKSDKYKYLFVHIPKTAGTAMELALLGAEGTATSDIDVNNYDEVTKARYILGGAWTHMRIRDYLDWPVLRINGGLKFSDYFKFTIVRNPWSRMVSEYKYCLAGGVNNELTLNYSFKEFCYKWRDGELTESQVYPEHLLPQHEFISSDIDYIGRFECLDRSFNNICSHLGLPINPLPATNVSTRMTDYVEYYDDESRNLVRRIFERDVDEFSYTFGDNIW